MKQKHAHHCTQIYETHIHIKIIQVQAQCAHRHKHTKTQHILVHAHSHTSLTHWYTTHKGLLRFISFTSFLWTNHKKSWKSVAGFVLRPDCNVPFVVTWVL